MAAGDLHGDRAEQNQRGVQPQHRRHGGGQPGVDGVVIHVDAASGLRDREDTDQSSEEEKDGAEREEEAKSISHEALARASRVAGTIVPVVVVAPSAGALQVAIIGRASTVASIVLCGAAGTAFEIGGRDDRWHPVPSHAR